MRIFFDSYFAWEFLRTHGFVFTLRKPANSDVTVREVEVWRKGKSTGIKAMKVRLGVVSSVVDLVEYAPHSGFSNAEEWLAEAHKLSGESRIWDLFWCSFLVH